MSKQTLLVAVAALWLLGGCGIIGGKHIPDLSSPTEGQVFTLNTGGYLFAQLADQNNYSGTQITLKGDVAGIACSGGAEAPLTCTLGAPTYGGMAQGGLCAMGGVSAQQVHVGVVEATNGDYMRVVTVRFQCPGAGGTPPAPTPGH